MLESCHTRIQQRLESPNMTLSIIYNITLLPSVSTQIAQGMLLLFFHWHVRKLSLYIPYIYSYASWELPWATQVFIFMSVCSVFFLSLINSLVCWFCASSLGPLSVLDCHMLIYSLSNVPFVPSASLLHKSGILSFNTPPQPFSPCF